ncbi:MAG TPA: hypothetical protein VG014_01765 [Acidimicrobiales bacterium]|nr:hypothetical protein [Acidimicrobiales bacterium]
MRSSDVAASRMFRRAGSLVAPASSRGSVALCALAGAPAVMAAGAKAISEALPTD